MRKQFFMFGVAVVTSLAMAAITAPRPVAEPTQRIAEVVEIAPAAQSVLPSVGSAPDDRSDSWHKWRPLTDF